RAVCSCSNLSFSWSYSNWHDGLLEISKLLQLLDEHRLLDVLACLLPRLPLIFALGFLLTLDGLLSCRFHDFKWHFFIGLDTAKPSILFRELVKFGLADTADFELERFLFVSL